MKKKLLVLFMILVLTMTAFVGCGKDDEKDEKEKADTSKSSYFKEMSEMADLDLGSAAVDLDFAIKGEALKSQDTVKDYLDASGDLTGKLTFDITCESETKFAMDISAKVGDKIDGKMATIAYDGQYVYVEYAELLNVIKDIAGEETVSQIEQQVGTSVKIDFNKVSELALNAAKKSNKDTSKYMDIMSTFAKAAMDKQEEAKKFEKSLFDAFEKDFNNITDADDDMYTLTVTNENIGTVIDAVVTFLNDDAEALVVEFLDIFADEFEKSGVSVDDVKSQLKDTLSQAVTSIQKEKENIVKGAGDVDFKVVSKVNVDEGKGCKFSIETNDISVEEDMSFGGSINMDYTVGTKSITDKIPTDASDITTLVTMALSNIDGLTGAESAQ